MTDTQDKFSADHDAIADILEAVSFDDRGLVAALARQHDTGEALMLAWMNRDSLEETLSTGRVCYWSRSRGKLWRKGETSGQVQTLYTLFIDCDGDTLILDVDQKGVACHTGRRSCFYRKSTGGKLEEVAMHREDPKALYSG